MNSSLERTFICFLNQDNEKINNNEKSVYQKASFDIWQQNYFWSVHNAILLNRCAIVKYSVMQRKIIY